MSLELYSRFLIALVVVLVLLAIFAWLARRFGFAGRNFAAGGRRRLAIVEVMPIDGKRRLVLLRRDRVEHLILLGSDNAIVIESGIGAAPSDSGTEQAGSGPDGTFAAMIKENPS